MADSKISELTATTLLVGTEFTVVVQDGETLKITLADIAAYILTATAIIPSNIPYRGARVRLSNNISPASGGFEIIAWDVQDRDTDNFWSLAQPSRFIIPTGVSKIRLKAYMRSGSGAPNRHIYLLKNGSYFIGGGGGFGVVGVTMYDNMLSSDVIDVIPGDYFELQTWGSSSIITGGEGSPTGLATWFSLEVCEVS